MRNPDDPPSAVPLEYARGRRARPRNEWFTLLIVGSSHFSMLAAVFFVWVAKSGHRHFWGGAVTPAEHFSRIAIEILSFPSLTISPFPLEDWENSSIFVLFAASSVVWALVLTAMLWPVMFARRKAR